MEWTITYRADPRARAIADRHYNRQSIGSDLFCPPGRALILVTENYDALWVTSWPFKEYTKHEWAGAMVNSLFRNEGSRLSSDLIREAVEATVGHYGQVPDEGFVTFVDASKVRRKRDPGRCYVRAGWAPVGQTKGGLLAFQAQSFPINARAPRRRQLALDYGL